MVRGPSASGGHLENDNNNNIADALPANAAASSIQMLKSVYIWTPAAAMPMSV